MRPQSVDDYIASAPKELHGKLKELRKIIKQLVPHAEEKLSYGIPYYAFKGRLAYFAFAKNHIGFYIPPPIVAEHGEELKDYKTTKSGVHLHLDKPLPVSLIKKLIKARMKKIEQK